MFFRKHSKVDVVDQATRQYDDQVREANERKQVQNERIHLAIRFQKTSWLFKQEHANAIVGEAAVNKQLEDHQFISKHNSLKHRAYMFVKEAIFPSKPKEQKKQVDAAAHFARKKEYFKQVRFKADLIHQAIDTLSKPKMPAHHMDAVRNVPGYRGTVTDEFLKFQEDYLIANRPIANPPGISRKVEELKDIEEVQRELSAQNGDAYCPGSYHNYLGQERIYALQRAPATMKAIFRFSEPILREEKLLPDKKKEAKLRQKAESLKQYLLKPFYRFKRGALDFHRKPMEVYNPYHYRTEEGLGDEDEDADLRLNGGGDTNPSDAPWRHVHYVEDPWTKRHGPPVTPTYIGYGNSRKFVGNAVPPLAETRKHRYYPIGHQNLGDDSETLTWADLGEREGIEGPESLEIKSEYRRKHKQFFDRKYVANDIEEKFIKGVQHKSKYQVVYESNDTNANKGRAGYDEFGNRIEKSFHFHTEEYDEVSDNGYLNEGSNEYYRSYHESSGREESDVHLDMYASMMENSSSIAENIHYSQYFAQEHNHFVNDNDTHIASRASNLSMHSMESRFHVPIRMRRKRKIRGLASYRVKGGIKLISRSDRQLQRKAREDHRKEKRELEDKRKFMESLAAAR